MLIYMTYNKENWRQREISKGQMKKAKKKSFINKSQN